MILPMAPIFASLNTVLQAQEEENKRQVEEAMRHEDEQRTTCTDNYKRGKIPYGVCMTNYMEPKYCVIPREINYDRN